MWKDHKNVKKSQMWKNHRDQKRTRVYLGQYALSWVKVSVPRKRMRRFTKVRFEPCRKMKVHPEFTPLNLVKSPKFKRFSDVNSGCTYNFRQGSQRTLVNLLMRFQGTLTFSQDDAYWPRYTRVRFWSLWFFHICDLFTFLWSFHTFVIFSNSCDFFTFV